MDWWWTRVNSFINRTYKFWFHRNDHEHRNDHLQTQTEPLFIIKCDIVFTWNAVNSYQKPHQFWQHMSTHLLLSALHTSIEYKTTLKTFSQWIYCYSILLFNFAFVSELSLDQLYKPSDIVRAYIFHSLVLHHNARTRQQQQCQSTWPRWDNHLIV